MSHLWQRLPWYNEKDGVQNLSDAHDIIKLLPREIERRLMGILAPAQWLRKMREIIYDALLTSIRSVDGKSDVNWIFFDRINSTYKALHFLYTVIASNPILRDQFLKALEWNIEKVLSWYWWPNISEIIDGMDEDNFDEVITSQIITLGHNATIYFLEECMRLWKAKSKVRSFIEWKQKDSLEWANLDDLDYVNLWSLFHFKEKVDTQSEWSHFSLSWGISNAIYQLWIIRKHLASWRKIASISWTSMWWILAVLVSAAMKKDWDLELLIQDLKNEFQRKWRLYVKKTWIWGNEWLSTNPVDQRYDIRDIFIRIASRYWITEDTIFDDLPTPIIVNASYQSPRHSWEKEVILSWKERVIDSVRVWANMPGLSTSNRWILWVQAVRGLPMVDYAANEKWNPSSLLIRAWVETKDVIAIDIGYSSISYHTFLAELCRIDFRTATFRDMASKTSLKLGDWTVYDGNAEWSGNASGTLFSAEIFDKLIAEWEKDFDIQNPTSPSPQ